MSGFDYQLNPYRLGLIPYPYILPGVGNPRMLAAELGPPFLPDLWVTNNAPGSVSAWVAHAVLPRLYACTILLDKPVMGPFPYGFPVINRHEF